MRYRLSAFLALATLTACSPTAAPAPTPPPPAPTTAPAPAASPAAAAPAASPAISASPSAVAAEPVSGAVQSFSGTTLTLASGRSISVPSTARVQRSTVVSGSDLKVGDFVAVTAKRQPDNTLLASIVNVFPPSVGQVGVGQRPLPEGNLMTNAAISEVSSNGFTVTFPGGGARVTLQPDARVTRTLDATTSDLTPGTPITAQVVDGAARSVTITPPGATPQPAASPAAR